MKLTPEFPNISNVENCRDWNPGLPINLKLIRKKDEAYWKDFRATPKAFISLNAAQKIWKNKYGRLTSIRFYRPKYSLKELTKTIISQILPSKVGIKIIPVQALGLKAAKGDVNFGHLFL